MAGPTTTLGSPLNVGGGTGASSGTSGVLGDLGEVTNQVRGQSEQFSGLMKDPNFTGQSEMGAMLKLQREMSIETMIFQTVSKLIEKRAENSQKAIQGVR
ncbi:hypothetical protein L0244_23070 [bacterium]|nr:hypothetical protein [bacterium]MCI0615877.1 hypothetical protein [bacterium]